MVFSDSSSSEDIKIRRQRKKQKKSKKRRHRESDRHSKVYDSDSTNNNDSKVNRKRSKKEKQKETISSRKCRDYDSSSSDKDRQHRRDRKSSSRSKHKRKHSSRHKEKQRHERDRKLESRRDKPSKIGGTATATVPVKSKFDLFLPQLYELLSHHPDLAIELPYILIRIASGSPINLSQVQPSVAEGLRRIFQILGCTCSSSNEWRFDDGGRLDNGGTSGNERALVLIKLSRYLLDDKGLSMDEIQAFEDDEIKRKDLQKEKLSTSSQTNENGRQAAGSIATTTTDISTEISALTTMFLEMFQSEQKDKSSSLAKELFDILNMVAEKESICLDGIPDERLKEAMSKLFTVIGLPMEEMEDDSDSDDEYLGAETEALENSDGNKKNISYGYTLPETENAHFDRTKMNLNAAICACKLSHQKFINEKSVKRILGPSFPPPGAPTAISAFDLEEASDEDDVGPAPVGSAMAKKRLMKGPPLSSQAIKQMADETEAQKMQESTTEEGEREEWMMKPGEHDFLKGVLSKGIKNRTFKNEKGAAVDTAPDVPLDPKIQKQVDTIMKMHEEARGPSLVDAHRQQRAEEKKAAKGKGGDWSWSREKDLDAGRRVDKGHLRMVMGGASQDLKSKFQGSYSKSFT